MRISLLLFMICCCCFQQLHAQLTIGIKGGLVTAWENYGDANIPDDADITITGKQLTATAYWQLNKHFSLGTEPGYIQRGAACVPGAFGNFPAVISNIDRKNIYNFAELPVYLQVQKRFYEDRFSFYSKLGYGVAYAVNGKQLTVDTDLDEVIETSDMRFTSNLRRWDTGAYGGLGFGIHFGQSAIFAEYQQYVGLLNADRQFTSKNRSIAWTIGVKRTL